MIDDSNFSSETNVAVACLWSNMKERDKELSCIYAIDEIVCNIDREIADALQAIVNVVPSGWQYSEVCNARISYGKDSFVSNNFRESPWYQRTDIFVNRHPVGNITVFYKVECPPTDEGPFLKEERKLLENIAARIGHFIAYKRLQRLSKEYQQNRAHTQDAHKPEWKIALEILRSSDQRLFSRIARKMMNYLCWRGISEAHNLLERYAEDKRFGRVVGEVNQPMPRSTRASLVALGNEIFDLASLHLGSEEISQYIRKWIEEDKSELLVRSLVDLHLPISTIADTLKRHQQVVLEGGGLSPAAQASVRVSLLRRFLMEQLEFINIAKKYIQIEDFYDLVEHIIATSTSYGKLGGKSAGLFVATRILEKMRESVPKIGQFKTPKTWYIPSDVLSNFLQYNKIEDIHEQKYKDLEEVRQEYPHITHIFKNSHFPQEVIKGLAHALDDFGEVPIIVRSSSLLEDRLGTAFSGKYKSLFLANQGTKKQRLSELLDAIAEVYASVLGPDPIEYRAERGLLDFNEEMGILLQEVVGTKVGHYFFPAFAGVAFSNNEFRWSSRINRKDGLLRIVPGLGTRAVDRLPDDYPVLIAPGQPQLRVNITIEDIERYSPHKIDVINLENGCFESKDFRELIAEYQTEYPSISKIVSIIKDNRLQRPMSMLTDFAQEDIVVSFDGLFNDTPFLEQIRAILHTLEQSLNTAVDIEFASDGQNFYLLQCRPQSQTGEAEPAQIPDYVAPETLLFSANRFVSNGRVPDLTHLVYVDPDAYSQLSEYNDLLAVGKAVSGLNKILPKRQFALIGPGRWGSRGDIKLGVNVTYSDINNTAILIEVARKKGNYTPDVSFGTHFFQDLVEASIRYLPLYPDDSDVHFNENFFLKSPNILSRILPEYQHLEHVLRVIDIPTITAGRILRVLMNAEQEKAVAILCEAHTTNTYLTSKPSAPSQRADDEQYHWRWRYNMAKRIGLSLDGKRFGVKDLYLFGSTKNGTAGPASDIDLIVHFQGSPEQRHDLELWFEGWSISLAEYNYSRTNCRVDGLLDFQIVTDQDIQKRTSFATKIGAKTDAAQKLVLASMGPSR